MSDWYVDGTIDGRQWTLIKGSHVQTPDGAVLLPMKHGNGAPQNALYLRVAQDGSRFACVGNDDDHCWEWVTGAWLDRGIAYGPQSVIYDNDGTLHIVPPPEAFGYRYVKPNNQIVTCTDSHFDQALKLWDYTKLGDVFIGQGGDGPHGEDPCIAIEADGSRRLISEGRCRFINAYREGDAFAIYCVREDTLEAKRFLLTRQQILELPEIEADITPVKPKPIPLDQVEPLVGKWLVSYYEQNGNCPPDKLPPGNAQVAVRNHSGVVPRPTILTSETEGKVTGQIIGYRVGSEAQSTGEVVTIEIMEERARAIAAKGYRPCFYWDSPIVNKVVQHTIPRWPDLPPGSVVELNAFCGRNESIESYAFEMERYIREAAEHPYLLALAAQTHTTNLDLIREPSTVIPPMLRLCRQWRAKLGDRFLGINVFNNSGRDFPAGHPQFGEGGLTANPQLVPHWTKVFSGVTGLPDVLLGGTGGNGGGGGDVGLAIRLGPYAKTVSRGAPYGLDIPYDIDSDHPIVRLKFEMQDGSEAQEIERFKVAQGASGLYFRGLHFKPVINGPHRFVITIWDDQGNQASVTSEPVTVTSSGNGGGGPATIKEYKDYFAQRWRELGIDTQSQAIADREGFANLDKFEELNPDNTKVATDPALWDQPRYERIANECKAIQCPALIRIAGELYHQQGHRDVGLNVKEGGNRFSDPRIPRSIAADIFAIKPSDDAGNVVAGVEHIIDTMFAVGTPFSRPDWNSDGENRNTARPWIEPPQP